MTHNPDFKKTPLLDVEQTIDTWFYYMPLIASKIRPIKFAFANDLDHRPSRSFQLFCLKISAAYFFSDRKSRQSNERWHCRWHSVTFEGHFTYGTAKLSVLLSVSQKYSILM